MEEHDIEVTALTRPSEAILYTWIGLGTGYASRLVGTGFSAVRDVHGEWKARLKDVFDNVEATQQGLTALARKLTGHVDAIIEDALSTSEQGIGALVRTLGSTADDAVDAAARAGTQWISPQVQRKAS